MNAMEGINRLCDLDAALVGLRLLKMAHTPPRAFGYAEENFGLDIAIATLQKERAELEQKLSARRMSDD